MSRPAFTVVIPSHDDVRELECCLAGWLSEARASDADLSIVVVDNDSSEQLEPRVGPTEGVPITLVRRVGLAHPFALSSARNIALQRTETTFVITCDADCIPAPGYLAAATELVERHGDRTFATGERIFISGEGVEAAAVLEGSADLAGRERVASVANYGHVRDLRLPEASSLPDVEHPWTYMHGCNTIFPLAAAHRAGGYDERYDGSWGHEDIDFAHRMITEASCTPVWGPDLGIYHLEPTQQDHRTSQRTDRREDPNWERLCAAIPGYRSFKQQQYRRLGLDALRA